MSSRAGGVLYLDSSALVKLAVLEPETAALEAELMRWPLCATSSITAIEVSRVDAIHVASALALGPDLAAVVTYDVRMQQAAEGCRLRVLAPA